MLQERVAVSEGRVHSHLVLPFKLSPHIPAEVHVQHRAGELGGEVRRVVAYVALQHD